MVRKIFQQFDFEVSDHIVDIILLYCSTIYVVAFFESGCSGGCGEGSLHASLTNISSQYDDVLQVFRVSYQQTIFIQFNWTVNYACCCSGFYIPEIYNSREECEEEHFSNGETEYGAVSVYNYADIYRQLQESSEQSIELYVD